VVMGCGTCVWLWGVGHVCGYGVWDMCAVMGCGTCGYLDKIFGPARFVLEPMPKKMASKDCKRGTATSLGGLGIGPTKHENHQIENSAKCEMTISPSKPWDTDK
jgi:hypothetical protein